MNRRRVALAALAALAAIGLAYLLGFGRSSGTTAGDLAKADFRFAFPRGSRLDYDLRLESTQKAAAPKGGAGATVPSTIDATIALKGGLELRGYGPANGDGWRVGVVLRRLDEQSLRVLDADGLAGISLADREAIVELGPRGEIRAIATPSDAPDAWKSVAHLVIQALAVTAPPMTTPGSSTWVAEEGTPLGRARSEYKTGAAGEGAFAWERTRPAYATLAALGGASGAGADVKATAKIHVDRQGNLARLEARDRVALGSAKLDASLDVTMSFVGKGTFEPADGLPDDGALERRSAGDPISASAMRKKTIEQMAGTVTLEDVVTRIRALSAGVPVEEGWMTHAVAFLMLHPEAYAAIAKTCDDADANGKSRAYVLDLLRSVGTSEAQKAMRSVLSSAVVRADSLAYPALVERLALVSSPDLETVKFAEATLDGTSDPLVRRAALVALGSTAGARHRSAGDASQYVARVGAELGRAKTDSEKQGAIAALGNAGAPDTPKRLKPHAADASPAVRAEVATALRKVHTKEARDVLVELLVDRDARVSRATLRSLEQHPLDRAELARIADVVAAPGFSPAADDEVLTLAAKQSADRETTERMLRAVAGRNDGSPKLKARAEMLLAAMAPR